MGNLINNLPELRQQVVDEAFKLIKQPIDNFVGIRDILKIKTVPRHNVKWAEYESATGLMQPALPGEPAPKITVKGMTVKVMEGIPFKEKTTIDVEDLAFLQQSEKTIRQNYLLDRLSWLKTRAFTRMEKLVWDALAGSISISENGVVFSQSYSIQTYAGDAWSTASTDILADIRAMKALYVGKGATPKTIVMNTNTYNYIKKNDYFTNIVQNSGKEAANKVISNVFSDEGLDVIVYDGGYIDSTGTFNYFIPNNKVFMIGEGPYPLGNFVLVTDPNTATFSKKPKAGFWTRVIEHEEDPYSVEIVGGFKGAPAITFPTWVVLATVS